MFKIRYEYQDSNSRCRSYSSGLKFVRGRAIAFVCIMGLSILIVFNGEIILL